MGPHVSTTALNTAGWHAERKLLVLTLQTPGRLHQGLADASDSTRYRAPIGMSMKGAAPEASGGLSGPTRLLWGFIWEACSGVSMNSAVPALVPAHSLCALSLLL